MKNFNELMDRHEAFLNCLPADRPLIGRWFGGYFPSGQFPRGASCWRDGQVLQPDDVKFGQFADDYENLYRKSGVSSALFPRVSGKSFGTDPGKTDALHCNIEDDWFFVASAYWGIPWLEAILGCQIESASFTCRAESGPDGIQTIDLDSNAWFSALEQFTRELVAFAAGRFPVCPPLLRGPGDSLSAMMGGTDFILGFDDSPDMMRSQLKLCTEVRMDVIRRLQAIIPPWHGTHAAGGYPSKVWCRRTAAYHQEDSAALLSPAIFREFLLPVHRRMCAVAEVNFIHLHSSCLYPVDILLDENLYDVLEINIDHAGTGPALKEMMPVLHKIQAARKPLLLWGEFSPEEWKMIMQELTPAGLSLQPIMKERT